MMTITMFYVDDEGGDIYVTTGFNARKHVKDDDGLTDDDDSSTLLRHMSQESMHENVKGYDGLTNDGDVAHCCIIILKSLTQKSKYQRDHLVGQ